MVNKGRDVKSPQEGKRFAGPGEEGPSSGWWASAPKPTSRRPVEEEFMGPAVRMGPRPTTVNGQREAGVTAAALSRSSPRLDWGCPVEHASAHCGAADCGDRKPIPAAVVIVRCSECGVDLHEPCAVFGADDHRPRCPWGCEWVKR